MTLAHPSPSRPAGREAETFFHSFLLDLRKHPALENSHIILCGERNTGHEVHYLSDLLALFTNKSVISQKGTDDEGWWTDPFNKQRQLDDTDRAFGAGQIRFLEDWTVASGFAKQASADRRKVVLEQFESELRRWGEHEKETDDPSRAPSVFISGRVGKDGRLERSARDDLAFSLCFNIWLNRLVRRRIAPGADYQKIFGMPQRVISGRKRKRTE